MKFYYRGIACEKQIPSLEITEQEIMGKYRGTPFPLKGNHELDLLQARLMWT